MVKIGLDIGSTTIKCVALDQQDGIVFASYRRHYSQVAQSAVQMLEQLYTVVPKAGRHELAISGSAGMGLAESCGFPFVQEVYGTRIAAGKLSASADVIIEIGGEDAKILFLSGGLEVRMNGSCAGGTGAFLDQMATLMEITIEDMDEMAARAEKEYPIASRCGVFAKSDIQPLLNQGARKEDIAASILSAVVSQSITGLAQGRPIAGSVLYLGGPLTFLSSLRACFDRELKTTGICPDHSLYYVALGAAYTAESGFGLEEAISRVHEASGAAGYHHLAPLFEDAASYEDFCIRHNKAVVEIGQPGPDSREAYFGVDSGSTTIKMVLTDEEDRIIHSSYGPNNGDPAQAVKDFLEGFYHQWPHIAIAGSAATGYGEDMIKAAFRLDYGVVETIAHYKAATRFMPEVDFIIDIGGQDIKCFKVKNKAIDNIFLNEACSSGCGSFLQTFAHALEYETQDFAALGLYGSKPVDLGSRCTVFMNSMVKQAQKDGASIEDISAGLSISVVKNALYKVIRPTASEPLGKHIVVQGGTFLNDCVLRAFEEELDTHVVRPNIAGLMGAYGAALYAKERRKAARGAGDIAYTTSPADAGADKAELMGASSFGEKAGVLSAEELERFTHETTSVRCALCNNHCPLTISVFCGERRYISGNRCSRAISEKEEMQGLNLYAYKRKLMEEYSRKGARESSTALIGTEGDASVNAGRRRGRGRSASIQLLSSDKIIGIPFGLNLYELLPFWQTFFSELGYKVIVSPVSNRDLYLLGQGTVASDTICYPAKLIHGHIRYLLNQGVDAIFYPCMTYNLDEGLGDNHYNCPVVAYYPEVISANEPNIKKTVFINDNIGLHRPKEFPYTIHQILLKRLGGSINLKLVKVACEKAYEALGDYWYRIEEMGKAIIEKARQEGRRIIVLSGRPYHVDGEISHGIDQLINSLGAAVISEDAISPRMERTPGTVLNQWTYHSRLYAAAHYIGLRKDMQLVQLVSFGCGVDAVTTDEVRDILEERGKIYTQIKIDEIANLGAAKIRLRSLLEAAGGGRGL